MAAINYQNCASDLPSPDPAGKAHSERVSHVIRQEIETNGGKIDFARFMELALYAPGLGYYSAGSRKLGKEGDFVTAPEISPLFSQCLAVQCEQALSLIDERVILEFGAGSGAMAAFDSATAKSRSIMRFCLTCCSQAEIPKIAATFNSRIKTISIVILPYLS